MDNRSESHTPALPSRSIALVLSALASPCLLAQATVPVIFATPASPGANVDSCAAWMAPELSGSLLFITEKDGDRVQVHHAGTGVPYAPRPYLGGPAGSGPGEFNRPNGVWVLYHVPLQSGFSDVLLVTDQENLRVQAIRLPGLDYLGEFGTGQVGRGYGIAWYHDGTDIFVFITDYTPPAASPGKIKKYRLRPQGAGLGADLLFAVGSDTGNPPLTRVESIVADPVHDRLHLCGDEGGRFNRIFRLDGTYTGVTYGDPQFEFDQEGINLYDAGHGRGHLLVSDQHTDGTPNEFEIFDRATLAPLGNFRSRAGGSITTNTDGAYLEQRPLPGFPNGAFYAINDDSNAHAYDWTDIAEALRLEIVALDRPFPGAAPDGGAPDASSRNALWHHDGSWWGAVVRGGTLTISRLEDGTFAPTSVPGAEGPVSVQASKDALFVLVGGGSPAFHRFSYDAPLRRYRSAGQGVLPAGLEGPFAELAVETDAPGNPRQGWIAWVAGGEVKVAWSDAGLAAWQSSAAALGTAAGVLPRLTRAGSPPGATGLLWGEAGGVALRLHTDGSPAGDWSPREAVDGAPAAALAAASLPDGRLLVAAEDADGQGWFRTRSDAGAWSGRGSLGEARGPALAADPLAGRVHLFHGVEVASRRILYHRTSDFAPLAFGPPALVAGWPAVDLSPSLTPASLPDAAHDLVAVSMGNDGLGYFGRIDLSRDRDLGAPITLQHSPAPGAAGVARGATVSFRITDDFAGVDRSQLKLLVDGAPASPRVRGVPRNLLVSHVLPPGLTGLSVHIRIEAADLASPARAMTPFEYELFFDAVPGPLFRRGDANDDGDADIADAVRILLGLFAGLPPLACADAGDANDDGLVDLSDVIYLLAWLFLGKEAPTLPGHACGLDRTADGLGCEGQASCGA